MEESEINKMKNEINSRSIQDFGNLSPKDMHELIHNPFSSNSIIQFRSKIPNSTLDKIGFLKLSKYLLEVIKEEKEIKLTKWNNLNTKLVTEIYKLKFTNEEVLELKPRKVYRQEDLLSLQNAVMILNKILGLIKIRKNRMSLTKKGEEILKNADSKNLLQQIFKAYGINFNWAYHDAYSDSNQIQRTFGYILYLLLQYGEEERSANFYASKLNIAFPFLIYEFDSNWSTPENHLRLCLTTRCFQRFLNWFNFIDVRKKYGGFSLDNTFVKNNLLGEILKIDNTKFQFKKTKITHNLGAK